MISIEFDRTKMRTLLARYLAFYFGGLGLAALAIYWLVPYIPDTGLLHWSIFLLLGVAGTEPIILVPYIGLLYRGLKKPKPAVIINHAGIVDNASQFALGQLAWNEIDKMYPCDYKFRLLISRWSKMPVIFKQRGVAVILKDDADLQHLLKNKPAIIRPLSQNWYRSGKRRWVFIPEMVLPVTANELMQQLNKFYVTQVRGY